MDIIPQLLPPEDTPAIRSRQDLHRQWRAFMGPLGFSGRMLWWTFLTAEGRLTPLLSQIDDAPQHPDRPLLASLARTCRQVCTDIDPHATVAFLLSRPGGAELTPADHAWGTGLHRAAAEVGLRTQPFFVATDVAVMAVESPTAA